MARKKGLGRGLDALIPQNILEETDKKDIQILALEKLIPRKNQPRKFFDPETLKELADSIKEHGVLSPLIVRKQGDVYEIIAGERRFQASKIADLSEIPVIVKELSDREVEEISLIENIQREDLNAMEEAVAYRDMMDRYQLTQQELAQKMGKSRTYIANMVRLLHLDDESLAALQDGKITKSQARTLLSLTNLTERKHYLQKLLDRHTNVRQIERVAKKKKQDPYMKDVENRLLEKFGTKVQIIHKKKGGKIQIEYLSQEDLERILEILNVYEG